MVLILIEIWQFWLKENVRFWHEAVSQPTRASAASEKVEARTWFL